MIERFMTWLPTAFAPARLVESESRLISNARAAATSPACSARSSRPEGTTSTGLRWWLRTVSPFQFPQSGFEINPIVRHRDASQNRQVHPKSGGMAALLCMRGASWRFLGFSDSEMEWRLQRAGVFVLRSPPPHGGRIHRVCGVCRPSLGVHGAHVARSRLVLRSGRATSMAALAKGSQVRRPGDPLRPRGDPLRCSPRYIPLPSCRGPPESLSPERCRWSYLRGRAYTPFAGR